MVKSLTPGAFYFLKPSSFVSIKSKKYKPSLTYRPLIIKRIVIEESKNGFSPREKLLHSNAQPPAGPFLLLTRNWSHTPSERPWSERMWCHRDSHFHGLSLVQFSQSPGALGLWSFGVFFWRGKLLYVFDYGKWACSVAQPVLARLPPQSCHRGDTCVHSAPKPRVAFDALTALHLGVERRLAWPVTASVFAHPTPSEPVAPVNRNSSSVLWYLFIQLVPYFFSKKKKDTSGLYKNQQQQKELLCPCTHWISSDFSSCTLR